MQLVCLDLEGVLVPEIWIAVAERTGIDELRLTTRDIADYDELMGHRLGVLERAGIGLPTIQSVVAELQPLDGAKAFLDTLRERFQVAILSDTFYEFAGPLMRQLGRPFLLCHRLQVAADGRITGYRLRQPDAKRRAVEAFRSLGLTVLAAGDSYNDSSMLLAADFGCFFRAPQRVRDDFPQLPVTAEYDELLSTLQGAAARLEGAGA